MQGKSCNDPRQASGMGLVDVQRKISSDRELVAEWLRQMKL